MAWRRNPRVVTKEHFSTGTTIDGNRVDRALDDVVDRVNNVPYGDLKKRWMPTTYVAGWTPQSPDTLEQTVDDITGSAAGQIAPTHHWPWMKVRNRPEEVAAGTIGAADGDDVVITNQYRVKGGRCPGVFPFGRAVGTTTNFTLNDTPFGAQYAWTRSWFIENPSILDHIDLILETDHQSAGGGGLRVYNNDFKYGDNAPDEYAPSTDDRGLVIVASVDSEFDREDRNMADIEVLRKSFRINQDAFSTLALPVISTAGDTYDDFEPKVGIPATGFNQASTIQGARIGLHGLNIPIHQNARLRISVLIPLYDVELESTSGWRPDAGFAKVDPWLHQKFHMTVTMLEEVTGG